MKLLFKEVDKEFLELITFLKDKEKILINLDSGEILIESNNISKLRAILNLLFRLIRIYENLGRTLSKL